MQRTTILCATLYAAIAGTSTTALAQARFGTLCQQDFQVDPTTGKRWQDTLDELWNRCAWFNDELDDTDIKVYYWSMHGLQSQFTDAHDQELLEDVSLVWIDTHSGVFQGWDTQQFQNVSSVGSIVMWDVGRRGFTNDLYLGNEATGLSILATYSCDLQKDDSGFGTRWFRVFNGGLRITVGSHGSLFSGTTTNECGEDFADNLQGSQTIKNAWKDAVSDWAEDQDASVTASGSTSTECHTRRDTMKWQNFGSFGRLRDNNVQVLCSSRWDNL